MLKLTGKKNTKKPYNLPYTLISIPFSYYPNRGQVIQKKYYTHILHRCVTYDYI